MIENIEAKGKIDLDDVKSQVVAWELLTDFLSCPYQDEGQVLLKKFYDHICSWNHQRIIITAATLVDVLHYGTNITSFSRS